VIPNFFLGVALFKISTEKSPSKLLKIKLFILPVKLKQEIDGAEVGCPRPKSRGDFYEEWAGLNAVEAFSPYCCFELCYGLFF